MMLHKPFGVKQGAVSTTFTAGVQDATLYGMHPNLKAGLKKKEGSDRMQGNIKQQISTDCH